MAFFFTPVVALVRLPTVGRERAELAAEWCHTEIKKEEESQRKKNFFAPLPGGPTSAIELRTETF